MVYYKLNMALSIAVFIHCVQTRLTSPSRSVMTYKYNVSVNNTTLYFIYNKNSILSERYVATFIGSSSGPLRKQIQELSMFQCIVGSQMLTNF